MTGVCSNTLTSMPKRRLGSQPLERLMLRAKSRANHNPEIVLVDLNRRSLVAGEIGESTFDTVLEALLEGDLAPIAPPATSGSPAGNAELRPPAMCASTWKPCATPSSVPDYVRAYTPCFRSSTAGPLAYHHAGVALPIGLRFFRQANLPPDP